ncbi:MAG: sigma-70 family RNA polymerase sigma factor [Bacteroidia bacterium]|nr:sigma-70 family RNA polymerase sigma factor [Bacteroidia bacterium]
MERADQDRRAIERIKAGEHAAFKELIARYKDEAFSLACSILKDETLAEDVLQESFIKAFNKLNSFKYESRFYTWFYRIVVNRCYNEQRKKRFPFQRITEAGTKREEAASLADANDRKQLIDAALKMMKANEALVLRLFYLSEMKVEEVIKVTGFSRSKVKVSLHRGRKSFADILRRQLGKEIEDL